MKTPIKKVLKFYKYWDSFETWRDFSCYDEYNLDEASDKVWLHLLKYHIC